MKDFCSEYLASVSVCAPKSIERGVVVYFLNPSVDSDRLELTLLSHSLGDGGMCRLLWI